MNIKVKVVDKISQRDYMIEGHEQRLKFTGKVGRIIMLHDSHGLCYDVEFKKEFAPNGEIATYDPDELILC